MEAKAYSVEKAQEIKNLAEQVARERIAPHATERDVNGEFPRECLRIFGEASLMGAIISEGQGGSGIGRLAFASIVQELAGACDCLVRNTDHFHLEIRLQQKDLFNLMEVWYREIY
jgi:alkylation response protein AidB-like acyl-CoA dehydrogenase